MPTTICVHCWQPSTPAVCPACQALPADPAGLWLALDTTRATA